MTFYTYMKRNYHDADTPEGDLARDMIRGKEHFPINRPCKFDGWYRLIKKYLEDCGACEACMEVFEECWEAYVKCEKSKWNRSSSRL